MYLFEKCCRKLRNAPLFKGLDPIWEAVTPLYERLLRRMYPEGLKRVINKTDVIYVPFELRHWTDTFEPEIWGQMMSRVHSGDTVADVGAFLGFYSFAFARRAGPGGRVVAFEPDPSSYGRLIAGEKFYKKAARLQFIRSAVGDFNGAVDFQARNISISSVAAAGDKGQSIKAGCTTLDSFFGEERLDVIKIDVEGYEGKVLAGARKILNRAQGFPRAIFIEVHPYAWSGFDTSGDSLLAILREAGYRVVDPAGAKVDAVTAYGEIIALKGA